MSDKYLDYREHTDEDCIMLKEANKTDHSNSSTGIKIQLEFLSLHLIPDSPIPPPENTGHFRNTEYTFVLTLCLNNPAPPPKEIS